MNGYVLDACALIALLNGEDGGEKLAAAFASDLPMRMAAVNVLEVAYDAVRRQNDVGAANEVMSLLERLQVEIVWALTPTLLVGAARFKARGRLSLADSIALAVELDARLLTADHHEFDAFEREGLSIFEWIR